MTPCLPFKSLPANPVTHTIGNEVIGTLAIPKYGSLTFNELHTFRQKLSELEGLPNLEYESSVRAWQATILLQSRLCPDWQFEHTIAPTWQIDASDWAAFDRPVSAALVEELSNFWAKEANRWEPDGYSMVLQGQDASEQAKAYAEAKGLVVVTRDDFSNLYYVFRPFLVPKGGFPAWKVIWDFSALTVEEPEEQPTAPLGE